MTHATPSHASPTRRRVLVAACGVTLGVPALAQVPQVLPRMTEGPFYPPATWRAQRRDWDADLTQLAETPQRRARGEHLGLDLVVTDSRGRAIDNAEVEIWQCDQLGSYRHPSVELVTGQYDEAFQGFGSARSSGEGRVSFRTIRPAPYPGRTPHIHVRLRHAGTGELTSQLFVAGDPGNERDFLWRRLRAGERTALAMNLEPAAADSGLRWQARHAIVVPA